MKITIGCALLAFLSLTEGAVAADREIDASDPTKIYTYMGGGLKYTDYTNNESMVEVRAIGNVALGEHDMVLFETGYGWHDGDLVPGSNQDLTNLRFRWFHLFDMDYDLLRGYRGMGMQLDVQLAGRLKGTDGQNVIAAGILPTFAAGEEWNIYLFANLVGAWDKSFSKFNGAGVSLGSKFTYTNEGWWPGAQVNIFPEYKYFLTGTLQNEGSGMLEINIGGEISPTVMWDITATKNFDVYLRSFRRGPGTGLESDWNVFLNFTAYL